MAKVFAPRRIIATIRKRKHITDAHREELERLIAETDNYNHFTEKQKKDLIYLNRKSQRTHNYHAKLHMRGKKTKMKKGGKVVDDNTAMVLSQNKAIAHHTEELKKALNKNERVDAWVVGKIERASTDISDVTHYLDGKTEYADGGDVESKYLVVETDKMGKKRVMGRYNDFTSAEVYAMMKNDFMMRGRSVSIEDAEGKVVKQFEKGGAVELKPLLDKDGTRRIDAKAIDRLEMLARELPQTKYMHLDKNGRYVPKRKQLHKKIVDGFIKNKPCVTNRQPIAILTGGAPASGKSTFIKKYVDLDPDKVYHIDADEVRAMLPEFKGWNASQTHLETSDITAKLIDTIGVPCEYDLIYDGTMNRADKYTELVNKLHRLGYKVFIIYISIPKELSIERSRERYQSSGRYVPKEVIDKVYSTGLIAFEDVAKNMADGYVRIDGVSGDILEKGGMEMPTNIEYAKGGKIGFEGLSNKVAKNYEGKAVKPEYQKLYGKTYSKEEAKEVGDKVASKVYRQQLAKMEMGGEVGDNALVLSANKMGYIVEVGKDTYTLRFPDGTQSVFRENELQIMNDDDYFANGGETNKQWVVYVDNDQRIVGTYDSERLAKRMMKEAWNSGDYESVGVGLKSDAYSDEYYAKGGATSSYNYGRSWHMDKRKFNKSENYELPIGSRKKAMGGYMDDDDYEKGFESEKTYLDEEDFAKIDARVETEYLEKDRKSGVHDKFTKYWYNGGREKAIAKYGEDESKAWEEAYEDFKDDFYKRAKGGYMADGGVFDDEGNLIDIEVGDEVVEYRKRFPNAEEKIQIGPNGRVIKIVDAMAKVSFPNDYEEWIPLRYLKKMSMGGYMADGGELKKGDKIVLLGKEFEFVRYEMDSSQGYDEERVILKDKDGIRSYPKDMVEAYSQYKMADGGEVGTWRENDLGDGRIELINSRIYIGDNSGNYGRGRYDVYKRGDYDWRTNFTGVTLLASFDDLEEAKKYGFNNSYAKGGYMADGGVIKGLNADEFAFLYVKRAIKSPYRDSYLQPIGLWQTPKAKEVEKSLISKGLLLSNGAITTKGKDLAKDIDVATNQEFSSGYLGTMSSERVSKFERVKQKFDSYAKGGTIKVGDKVRSTTFDGVEGEVVSKKGDMLFIVKNNASSSGDMQHDVLRIGEVEKMAKGGQTNTRKYNIVDEGKVVESGVSESKVIDYANTLAFYDLMDESETGDVKEIADFQGALNYLGMVDVEVVEVAGEGTELAKKNLYTIENLGTFTDEVEFILEVNSVEFNKKDDSIVAVTTESKIKLVVSDIEDIDEPEAKDIVVRTANKVLHGTYKEPTKKKFTEGMSEKTAERMLRKLGVVGNAPMSEEQKAKKDEKNAMILFTTEIDKKLFEQYKYGADMNKQDVVVKIFNPFGRGTWYVMNADPKDPDYLWGIVDLFDVEMGSMSREELVSLRIPPLGVRLERDLSFKPINAKELFERLQDGEQFKFGGNVEYKQKDFDNTIQ